MNRLKVQSNDYLESSWVLGATGLTTTKEGYLTGRICVTGAGVFKYYDENGKPVYRLRSVDEVSKATAGLNSKPITLRHPKDLVTSKTWNKDAVGFTGTDATWDGLNNFVTVTITDEKAIKAIREGKVKSVSAGYENFVVDESGNWQGVDYDQRQEEIDYNHIALVFEGRAGDGVKFRVNDSVELWEKTLNNNKDKEDHMKTISIDSVDYQADEAVIDALKKAQGDSASKQKALDAMTAERDAAKATVDAKDKEIAQLKSAAADEKAIAERVNARIALVKAADEAGVDKAESMDDKSIKAAIIGKAFADVSLDGKSDDYVTAMFDAAVASLKKSKSADSTLNGGKIKSDDSKDYSTDESVEKARNSFAARMRGEDDKGGN